jgi:hypothetical protein
MTHTPDTTARFQSYALRAAEGFLNSWEHYGHAFVPAAAIGGPATPAYYANMLAKAVHMLDDHAALADASAAATARDGHAFAVWEFYAIALRGRLSPTPAPLVAVWTPEDYAQTLADARRIGR